MSANLLSAGSPASGVSVTVACGERFTLNGLLAQLNRICGTDIEASYEPPRPGDVRHSQADISLARETIGFEPGVDFEAGLRATVEWFRQQ